MLLFCPILIYFRKQFFRGKIGEKMVIANFREYTAVLRDVYSRDAMGEIGAYYQALTNSGEELK